MSLARKRWSERFGHLAGIMGVWEDTSGIEASVLVWEIYHTQPHANACSMKNSLRCWEGQLSMKPRDDLDIVWLILRGQDTMADKEIKQHQSAVGLNLSLR